MRGLRGGYRSEDEATPTHRKDEVKLRHRFRLPRLPSLRFLTFEIFGGALLWDNDSEWSSGGNNHNQEYAGQDDGWLKPGVVGLRNIGNTCFMNSMLQCLASVPDLREFFTRGSFERDLNMSNRLGTQGKLAVAFANLLDSMQRQETAVTPLEFKRVLSAAAPQFKGYAQQDAHELCNYVLDQLHEDLNRVRGSKPITAPIDGGEDDGDVAVHAAEALRRHRLRNDSHIADLFEGQLKSTVTCGECGKRSFTFDPFLSLAVPLGRSGYPQEHKLRVVLRRLVGALQPIDLTLGLGESVSTFLDKAAKECRIPPDHLALAEVYSNKLVHLFEGREPLEVRRMSHDMLFLYELARPLSRRAGAEATVQAVIVHQRDATSRGLQPVGLPLLLAVPAGCTGEELYEEVRLRLRCYETEDVQRVAGESVTKHNKGATVRGVLMADAVEILADDCSLILTDGALDSEWCLVTEPATHSVEGTALTPCWELRHFSQSMYSADNELVEAEATPCFDGIAGSTIWGGGKPVSFQGHRHGSDRQVTLDWLPAAFDSSAGAAVYSDAKIRDSDPRICGVKAGASSVQAPAVSLAECLGQFEKEEELDEENAWFCPRCKAHVCGRKRIQLWSTPEVLVLQLKRFSLQNGLRRKLDVPVNFPLESLDLGSYCLNEAAGRQSIYDLRACSNHYGGLGGGHYTAFARDDEGSWFGFDDSRVSAVSPTQIVTSAAYVLVYTKRR